MQKHKITARNAKRLFRACAADGGLDAGRVRLVVQRVLEAGRRDGPATLERFLRLVRLDRLRHTARVESATPLSADIQAGLQADLRRTYGAATEVVFTEVPSLLGGMRITIGSDVYDGSVRAALAALEKRFEPGTTPPAG